MTNHELQLLSYLPKTIILNIDNDGYILQCYGDDANQTNLHNENINNLFSEESLDKLNQLMSYKQSSVIVHYNNKEYEVNFRNMLMEKILYFYDVTKYSNIESKLKQSLSELTSKKEELQAVFDMAANGISILDKDGMFLYTNKFFQEMSEYSMDELYWKSCITLSSKEYEEPSRIAIEKAIKYGTIENFRKVCITKSGKLLNVSMSLSYLECRDEIVMITSDITEDIEYQDKLKLQIEQEVSKRAQQYEIMCHQSRLAAMGEMIDSIAHQWRQPLNGLGVIVQGLRHLSNTKEFDTNTLHEIESEIMEKITFMSQTIDDFSTFFRISKQKESFDILKGVNDAIRLIDIQLKNKNIDVQIDIEENLKPFAMGFENEFRQVILNMITNSYMAIIATKKQEGYIRIEISSYRSNLIISILDNGGGIKTENLTKIFDPYFTTKDKGNGIGLYMSKIIIEHHMDGLLKVKNTKDGAKFTILIEQDK